MRLIVIGPGRAGGSVALAAERVGHEIVGVLSRSGSSRWHDIDWDHPLPEADLAFVAVNDDAINDVSHRIAHLLEEVGVVAHMSGFVPVLTMSVPPFFT